MVLLLGCVEWAAGASARRGQGCQVPDPAGSKSPATGHSGAVTGVRKGKTLPGIQERSVRESPVSSKVRRGGGEREEGRGAVSNPLDSPAATGEGHSKADYPLQPAWEQEPGAGLLTGTAQPVGDPHWCSLCLKDCIPAEDPCWSSSWIPTAQRNGPGWSRRTVWGSRISTEGLYWADHSLHSPSLCTTQGEEMEDSGMRD